MPQDDPTASKYPHLYAPKNGYIFVATYGRSGSTLLMKILNAIEGACIRGENGNVLNPMMRVIERVRTEINFSTRRTRVERARKKPETRIGTVNDPWFGAEHIDPEDFAKSLLDTFVRCILSPPPETTFLGFKEIRFLESPDFFDTYMDYVLKYFPNSKMIFQTRNLEEVSRSGWWKRRDPADVIRQLSRADKMFQGYFSKRPDRCIMFDYSAFAQGPAGIKPLLDFLEVEISEEKLQEILSERLTHSK